MPKKMSRRELKKEIVRMNTPLWDRFKDWLFMWVMIILIILLIIMAIRLYNNITHP